jgi:hypothetical protein
MARHVMSHSSTLNLPPLLSFVLWCPARLSFMADYCVHLPPIAVFQPTLPVGLVFAVHTTLQKNRVSLLIKVIPITAEYLTHQVFSTGLLLTPIILE